MLAAFHSAAQKATVVGNSYHIKISRDLILTKQAAIQTNEEIFFAGFFILLLDLKLLEGGTLHS